MAIIRIGWNNLPRVTTALDGQKFIFVLGTKSDDDVIVDLPAWQAPRGRESHIDIPVVVFGGPGNDRITSAIGTANPIFGYGDIGTGDSGIKFPASWAGKPGGNDLIQGKDGGRYVGGNGRDTIDLHGLGENYKNNPTQVVMTQEDRLFLPADEGVDVLRFRFDSIERDGPMRTGDLRYVHFVAADSNELLNGYEIILRSNTNRGAVEKVQPFVVEWDAREETAGQAVQDWLEDAMSRGGNVDQFIFG